MGGRGGSRLCWCIDGQYVSALRYRIYFHVNAMNINTRLSNNSV